MAHTPRALDWRVDASEAEHGRAGLAARECAGRKEATPLCTLLNCLPLILAEPVLDL